MRSPGWRRVGSELPIPHRVSGPQGLDDLGLDRFVVAQQAFALLDHLRTHAGELGQGIRTRQGGLVRVVIEPGQSRLGVVPGVGRLVGRGVAGDLLVDRATGPTDALLPHHRDR